MPAVGAGSLPLKSLENASAISRHGCADGVMFPVLSASAAVEKIVPSKVACWSTSVVTAPEMRTTHMTTLPPPVTVTVTVSDPAALLTLRNCPIRLNVVAW